MAFIKIDKASPTGRQKGKVLDDSIRELKAQIINNLAAISNYPSDGDTGTIPALLTTIWTTVTRPEGADLVDKVTGLNTDHGCLEYYDLASTSWKYLCGEGRWSVSGRPSSPPIGACGYNTDLAVKERWNGSAWERVAGGRRGDVKMWSGAVADIETGWVLADGKQRTHPEGGNFTPPDLRDRFILGAGYSYAVGATGGEGTHTLTESEMPSHSHGLVVYEGSAGGAGSPQHFTDSNGSVWQSSRTTMATGGGQAHNNIPPYYALCFLYKL